MFLARRGRGFGCFCRANKLLGRAPPPAAQKAESREEERRSRSCCCTVTISLPSRMALLSAHSLQPPARRSHQRPWAGDGGAAAAPRQHHRRHLRRPPLEPVDEPWKTYVGRRLCRRLCPRLSLLSSPPSARPDAPSLDRADPTPTFGRAYVRPRVASSRPRWLGEGGRASVCFEHAVFVNEGYQALAVGPKLE